MDTLADGLEIYTAATDSVAITMGGEAIPVAILLERCIPTAHPAAGLDDRLASIDMSTAYTACVDEQVYMRWREAEAAEWANIHRINDPPTDPRPLAPEDTNTSNKTNTDDDDWWKLDDVVLFILLLLWFHPTVEHYTTWL